MTLDCAIVGGGPAGSAAAVQLTRAGLACVLFEEREICGALRNARCIENYLGFPGGVPGDDLAGMIQRQLAGLGIVATPERVEEIAEDGDVFLLRTGAGPIRARSVIVATGTVPRRAGLPGEEEYGGRGVYHELRDMPELPAKSPVIVLGGGDTAFDYALRLSERGYTPTIVMRSGARCLPLLREHATASAIRIVERAHPTAIRYVRGGVLLETETTSIEAAAALIAVGRVRRSPPVRTEHHPRRILYAGDVRAGRLHRHAQIAAGAGLRAAARVLSSSFFL